MKKNTSYMQTCVMNEVSKIFSMHEIAQGIVNRLNKKNDVSVTVYETNDDGFAIRKKSDGTVTDNELVHALGKVVKELIENDADFADIISDGYDFVYEEKLITDGFLADITSIHRSGRLIYIEIDLQ